jgi:hypothetical protein
MKYQVKVPYLSFNSFFLCLRVLKSLSIFFFSYEDTYGHFLFPCSPKKEHKELIPPKGETPIRPDNGEKETAGDNPIDSTGIYLLL